MEDSIIRKLTPRELAYLKQFKRGELYNTDPDAVLRYYYIQKQRELNEARLRASQLSPNTQRILSQVRRIQNLSRVRDAEQQRRNRERKINGLSNHL